MIRLPVLSLSKGGQFEQNGTGSSSFGYTGEQEDASSGLVFLRARYYDPAIGIFLSRDQWPGSLLNSQTQNPFAYVGNNPINIKDPSGRCYPPIDFLRQVESVVCGNLDQAIYIYAHPHSTNSQAFGASAYIATWTVSHSALLVGTTILGGTAIHASVGAIARWGYLQLLTKPALAQGVQVGTGIAGISDDLATVHAAATGNTSAIGAITSMAAADGKLPFADIAATTRYIGSLLPKRGLPPSLSACYNYNTDRASGHIKRMQQAIFLSLDPGDIIAFRSRAFGSTIHDFGPNAIPPKPMGAKTIPPNLPYGKRWIKTKHDSYQFAISDMDAAWALHDGELIDDDTFMETIGTLINIHYGVKNMVGHGHHISGVQKGLAPLKDLVKPVYIYGPNGFLESGNMVDMLEKYAGITGARPSTLNAIREIKQIMRDNGIR